MTINYYLFLSYLILSWLKTNDNTIYVILFLLFTGQASITEFVISCYGWKEWKPTIPNAPLKYGYYTKKPKERNEFPFAYGLNMTKTEPTVFPVGDYSLDFQLDVVIYIYDSVNDPFRHVIKVHVSIGQIWSCLICICAVWIRYSVLQFRNNICFICFIILLLCDKVNSVLHFAWWK
jgi:hypothetical protein